MKKSFPEKISKFLFLWIFCSMLFVFTNANCSDRYIKETFSDRSIVKYEVFYPSYWDAFIGLTDAEVSARLATKEGFRSVTRDLKKHTFLLVLDKDKAVNLVTKVMFDFKQDEIQSDLIQIHK